MRTALSELQANPNQPAGDAATVREWVYRTVCEALIVGRIRPGKGVSLRSLAEALGVGVMPVREAVGRLCAEHALEMRGNRRVYVPEISRPRFEELMRARLLLEPECAVRALPAIDADRLAQIRAHDADVDRSYATGDAELYMAANYRFHFEIYRARASDVLVPLVESIWLGFGPFMRTVYACVGTTELVDKHALAVAAIERGDGPLLKSAIEADILDGMHLLGSTMFRE